MTKRRNEGGAAVGLEPVAGSDELRDALAAERLPVDDLAEGGRTFFRVREGAETLGFGGYEVYGESALIRSLVVLPEARKRGIGTAVAEQIFDHARKEGARRAYLLTEFRRRFFRTARLPASPTGPGAGRDPGHAPRGRSLPGVGRSPGARSLR